MSMTEEAIVIDIVELLEAAGTRYLWGEVQSRDETGFVLDVPGDGVYRITVAKVEEINV